MVNVSGLPSLLFNVKVPAPERFRFHTPSSLRQIPQMSLLSVPWAGVPGFPAWVLENSEPGRGFWKDAAVWFGCGGGGVVSACVAQPVKAGMVASVPQHRKVFPTVIRRLDEFVFMAIDVIILLLKSCSFLVKPVERPVPGRRAGKRGLGKS